jgi:hypothetical protein
MTNLGEPEGVSPRTASGSPPNSNNEFEIAASEPVPGFWREFASFLIHSPSWWLAPLVIVLVLLGLAVTMIPVEAMPFIYTLW